MGDPSLHAAVLSIGPAGAAPDPASLIEQLRGAGATITVPARVDSFVPVARQKLAAWVTDPAVGIIVVLGGDTDGVAAAALAPLVTESLKVDPGSGAESMRCQQTLVYLLPGAPEPQRRAFDELVRPAVVARKAQSPGSGPTRRATPVAVPVVVPPVVARPAPSPESDSVVELDTLGAEELASSSRDLEQVSDAMIETAEPVAPRRARTTSGRLPGVVPLPDDPPEEPPAVARTTRPRGPDTQPVVPLPAPRVRRDDDPADRPALAMFVAPKAAIGTVPKVLAAIALLAVIAVVVVLVRTRSAPAPEVAGTEPPRGPAVPPPALPEPPPPAPEVRPDAAPAGPEIEFDPATPVAPTDPATHAVTVPVGRPTRPTQGSADHPHVDAPAGSGASSTPAPVAPPDAAVEVPTGPPPPEGCDQVSCVLDQYSRPCCEQFKPKLTNHVPGIPETLDKGAVRSGVEPMKPVIIACGERSAAKGVVKIALEVSPDGQVTSASVADSPDPGLGECVAAALRKVHFGKTQNGASFVYPFKF